MKVTQELNPFKPISITLETKKEAELFWHFLRTNPNLSRYCEEKGLEFSEMDDLINTMWVEVSSRFSLEE